MILAFSQTVGHRIYFRGDAWRLVYFRLPLALGVFAAGQAGKLLLHPAFDTQRLGARR